MAVSYTHLDVYKRQFTDCKAMVRCVDTFPECKAMVRCVDTFPDCKAMVRCVDMFRP